MSGAPLIVLVLVIRLVVAAHRKKRGLPPLQWRPRFDGAWFAIVFLLGPFFAGALATATVSGAPLAAIPLAALLGVMFPWALATRVFVPLGLPRVAYYVALTSDFFWRLDHGGGAAVAASWAIARQRQPDPRAMAWLETRLARPMRLRGGGVVAGALLASARGDVDGARALMQSVGTLAPAVCPRIARRIALEWLAAEAASRGDWRGVAAVATGSGTRSRATRLLGAAALRLLDDPAAPSRARIALLYAVVPRPRAMWPFVSRVLAAPDRPFDHRARDRARQAAQADGEGLEPARGGSETAPDAFATALAGHARLVATRCAKGPEVTRVAAAWDRVLDDPSTEALLLERAFAIGASAGSAPRPVSPLARLRADVEEDLAALVRDLGIGLDDLDVLGETLGRVVRRLRDDILGELELRSDALRVRVDEVRALPPLDEWREWTSLRTLYERGVELGGVEVRRLAFYKLHRDVTHFAVWLFNVRKERALANAMFRFCLAESEALGDAAGIELQRKNVGCGI